MLFFLVQSIVSTGLSCFIVLHFIALWASLVAQMVKNLPEMWETWVRSLGRDDPLERGLATHSSSLAWESHGQRSLIGTVQYLLLSYILYLFWFCSDISRNKSSPWLQVYSESFGFFQQISETGGGLGVLWYLWSAGVEGFLGDHLITDQEC